MPSPLVLKAAEMILDRTGLGPKLTIETEVPDTDWMAWLSEEQLDVLNNMIEEAKSKMGEARLSDSQSRELIGEVVTSPDPLSIASATDAPALPPATEPEPPTDPNAGRIDGDSEVFE